MAEVKISAQLPASAEAVWAIIGDFAALADWHPLVPNCRLGEDGVSRIISLRGVEVVEVLRPEESPPMGHTYTILSSPMPITDYLATLQVVSEGDGARISYHGRFEPVGVSEEQAGGILRGFFETGFSALQSRLDRGEA
ncbi:MAG: hypothetical protein ACI8RZ_007178 [Myxococcota bacterium]|jgi:hypothetical protein